MSIGCNQLISDNKAVLLRGSDHFISYMGWEEDAKPALPVQKEIFPALSDEEEKLFNLLSNRGAVQVNTLAIELNIPVTELFLILLEMEMKHIVESLPGGMYQLV
jgi:DNA processing protein